MNEIAARVDYPAGRETPIGLPLIDPLRKLAIVRRPQPGSTPPPALNSPTSDEKESPGLARQRGRRATFRRLGKRSGLIVGPLQSHYRA